ncbi:MAG: glycosyltransferase [Chitinophagaceae bacterium]|nr:glycosyltransferase [Chitinophagaceae bacterium]
MSSSSFPASTPLVSIVLCTYNGEAYLPEQLKSLEEQSYPAIEFICSDNNSTDATASILQSWCSKSSNRHFFKCAERGLNRNFYSAIEHATGEYIIFCDQDDIWLNEKAERLVLYHQQHTEASMVYCLSSPFGKAAVTKNARVENRNHLEGMDIRKTMLVSFTLGHNICIRRDLLLKMQPSPGETVAYDWWISVSAMCIGPIKCLPVVLTHWRKHKTNTTHKINEGLFYETRINYLEDFQKNNLISPDQKKWIQQAINCFTQLQYRKFSFSLFLFLLFNARLIFFYKRKKNPLGKWISFVKWSYRISHQKFKVEQ